MPPPNGYEVRKILSDDPRTATIPFVFLTARAGQVDKIRGLESGADDYVTKPFNRHELLARVQAILRRSEIGRQKGLLETEVQVEKLRQEIMQNVSHELRTPMAKVLLTLDSLLESRFSDVEEENHFIQSALSSAHRLHGLIEDLTLLTEIDQGNLNTLRRELDLEYDFRAPLQRCLERYAEKNLDVRISVAPEVVVHAPEIGFRQAAVHLVDNACKFSSEEGQVVVHLAANGIGGCILAVADQGPGILPKLREKVFERYYQVSQGSTRQHGGLGVGLTIARAVARALGGEVLILAAPSGCRVRMTIPPDSNGWQSPRLMQARQGNE